MRWITRIVVLLVGMSMAIGPAPSHASPGRYRPLSRADRALAVAASRLAGSSRDRSINYLRHRTSVRRVALGQDGQTIEIWFADGAFTAILPAMAPVQVSRPALRAHLRALAPRSNAGATGRALVLEPFATQLSPDPSAAGQVISDLLTKAGFKVDVYRDDAVTATVMEHLADYSVVYMQTHSGVLDNGHAAIVLGEMDHHQYNSLMKECDSETPPLCSVMQMFIAGSEQLWVAITDNFLQTHVGTFSDSSIVFLNGCEILSAPAFVSRLHAQNVASVVSWDDKADSAMTELSANIFFTDMAGGSTVNTSLQDVSAKGFAASLVGTKTAYLREDGYGDDTLAQALAAIVPASPTATATATAQPTLTATPKPAKKACPKHSKKKKSKCVCSKGYTMKKGKCVKKK